MYPLDAGQGRELPVGENSTSDHCSQRDRAGSIKKLELFCAASPHKLGDLACDGTVVDSRAGDRIRTGDYLVGNQELYR